MQIPKGYILPERSIVSFFFLIFKYSQALHYCIGVVKMSGEEQPNQKFATIPEDCGYELINADNPIPASVDKLGDSYSSSALVDGVYLSGFGDTEEEALKDLGAAIAGELKRLEDPLKFKHAGELELSGRKNLLEYVRKAGDDETVQKGDPERQKAVLKALGYASHSDYIDDISKFTTPMMDPRPLPHPEMLRAFGGAGDVHVTLREEDRKSFEEWLEKIRDGQKPDDFIYSTIPLEKPEIEDPRPIVFMGEDGDVYPAPGLDERMAMFYATLAENLAKQRDGLTYHPVKIEIANS
jgi:hypothetical protein